MIIDTCSLRMKNDDWCASSFNNDDYAIALPLKPMIVGKVKCNSSVRVETGRKTMLYVDEKSENTGCQV